MITTLTIIAYTLPLAIFTVAFWYTYARAFRKQFSNQIETLKSQVMELREDHSKLFMEVPVLEEDGERKMEIHPITYREVAASKKVPVADVLVACMKQYKIEPVFHEDRKGGIAVRPKSS